MIETATQFLQALLPLAAMLVTYATFVSHITLLHLIPTLQTSKTMVMKRELSGWSPVLQSIFGALTSRHCSIGGVLFHGGMTFIWSSGIFKIPIMVGFWHFQE